MNIVCQVETLLDIDISKAPMPTLQCSCLMVQRELGDDWSPFDANVKF